MSRSLFGTPRKRSKTTRRLSSGNPHAEGRRPKVSCPSRQPTYKAVVVATSLAGIERPRPLDPKWPPRLPFARRSLPRGGDPRAACCMVGPAVTFHLAAGRFFRMDGFMARCFVVIALLLLCLACSGGDELPLAGTSWTLEAMGPSGDPGTISTATPITLEFSGDREMGGYTGCNSYSGTYDTDRSAFRADFMITEAGCPTRELYDREYAYKYTLWDARSIALVDSSLTIRAEDGRMLVFNQDGQQR